jgi:hypothetical protein
VPDASGPVADVATAQDAPSGEAARSPARRRRRRGGSGRRRAVSEGRDSTGDADGAPTAAVSAPAEPPAES